eukprot:gnl/MRDRNA2_/MRDRNA2_110617_c0_seq1.p1 gnl/MRDRNA2_/MRDRNA2_110617_c0~~gnl/MRDRNA2_/MRDRNA2_110617_c0_seq1.p1  ORF type:complete len:766 (-),score=143.90 gnl/MRDRNA2_/MRDRNA2_110617_c0_seq1:136-2214(-)
MDDDSASWHWCVVFPVKMEKDKDKWAEPVSDCLAKAEKCFTKRTWATSKTLFKEGMPKEQYHAVLRQELCKHLAGPSCGFNLGKIPTIDEDELFLLIALNRADARVKIADRQEMRMPVSPDQYPGGRTTCPTDEYWGGKFHGDSYCPIYMAYDARMEKKYSAFREVDILRMMRKRIRDFMHLDQMIAQGVIIKHFPVHKWEKLEEKHEKGWCRIGLGTICQYPGKLSHGGDYVRDYFGEEVGFFFHWFNFYTEMLFLPAILGFILFFRRFLMAEEEQRLVQCGFAFIMCLWSTFFTSSYRQRSNMKIEQWGMKNYDSVAAVRPEFDEKKRGTTKESMQNAFHWILAVFFMFETIGAVAGINGIRHIAKGLKDGETIMGMEGKQASKMAKYMMTANIKIVDLVWKKLSPALSDCENWKTRQQLKSAKVSKLFVVKFIIYYYPFFYVAFIKEHIEGCPKGCPEELQENLVVFFLTDIVTSIVGVVLPLLMTRRKVTSEITTAVAAAKAHGSSKPYSYLQAQAKCPKYEGDTDDFMELILSMGFIMMFSVELPVMTAMALCCNLLKLRLLAYRFAYVSQRTEPNGQEGIGAWATIVEVVSVVGVVCNAGLMVFELEPMKSFSGVKKLALFVAIEHCMLVLQRIIVAARPPKTLSQVLVEETNEDLFDDILGDDDKPVKLSDCSPPLELPMTLSSA